MRTFAEIYKALADETQLTILSSLLRHGELCVCDVEAILQISQSKASRHLRYLRNAGLLVDRREEIWVYYRVPEASESEAGRVIEANRGLIFSLVNPDVEQRLIEWLEQKAEGNSCEAQPKKTVGGTK